MDSVPVILVMEDELDQGYLLCQLIEEMGYTTVLTNCADQAMKAMESRSVDLIVTDIVVKDTNPDNAGGLELILNIRSLVSKKYSSMPIIAISGVLGDFVITSVSEIALAQGANIFLKKPINNNELFVCIEKLLSLQDGSNIVSVDFKTKSFDR